MKTIIITAIILILISCIDKSKEYRDWLDCPEYVFAPHYKSISDYDEYVTICKKDCVEQLKAIIRYHNLKETPDCYSVRFMHGTYYLSYAGKLFEYVVPTENIYKSLPGTMSTLELEVAEEREKE